MHFPRATLALCLLALTAMAEEPSPAAADWSVRHERTDQSLKAGTPVSITNLWGDVRVREVATPELTIVMVIQQHRDDPRTALVRKAWGPAFQLQPDFEGEAPANLYPIGLHPRIDLTVFVPPDSPVYVTTRSGFIEAKGMSGSVTATSDTGKILVQTPGLIRAYSRLGDLDIITKRASAGNAHQLGSETGNIIVRLPASGAVRVEARTRGRIASDYSMSVDHPATSTHKAAVIEKGSTCVGRLLWGWATGRMRIHIDSAQGDITVLAPLPELLKP